MIYKSFIRPHLGYGDVIYGKPNNESFKKKLKIFSTCHSIASRSSLYKELGLESLEDTR